MGGGAHGGFTRYHWVGLLVPVLATASLAAWTYLPGSLPQPVVAIIGGLVVGLLAYAMFRFVPVLKESSALGKAVVLAAIVTEMLTFHSYKHVPPASSLALAMFLYCYAAETADGMH